MLQVSRVVNSGMVGTRKETLVEICSTWASKATSDVRERERKRERAVEDESGVNGELVSVILRRYT